MDSSSAERKPQTSASMYRENESRRITYPPLTQVRRQKIQFFTLQTDAIKPNIYGVKGSVSWLLGLVEFINCPSVTIGVIQHWLDLDPSLIETVAEPLRPMTRSRTGTLAKQSTQFRENLYSLKKRKDRHSQSTYRASWHKFFDSSYKKKFLLKNTSTDEECRSLETLLDMPTTTSSGNDLLFNDFFDLLGNEFENVISTAEDLVNMDLKETKEIFNSPQPVNIADACLEGETKEIQTSMPLLFLQPEIGIHDSEYSQPLPALTTTATIVPEMAKAEVQLTPTNADLRLNSVEGYFDRLRSAVNVDNKELAHKMISELEALNNYTTDSLNQVMNSKSFFLKL